MIDEHRVLTIGKVGGGNLELEVNWRPEDTETNECKVIRVKDGDRQYALKRDDLVTILLIMGDAKTQKALLPTTLRKVRVLERMLNGSFKATKNYAKGDTIYYSFPWLDEIPVDEEVLSGNIGKLAEQAQKSKFKLFR